jgi:microcompartment protein CcmL/EutN
VNGDTAVGLLEVYGLAVAVAVADDMAKAAPVELLARLEIGDGLVTVVARGGVSAVQEAIAVGRRTATSSAALRGSSVLGRPGPGVTELFFGSDGQGPGDATAPVATSRAAVKRNRAARATGAQSKKRGGTSDV